LATCATFWESVTPSKRRTATYIALAYLLHRGGVISPA
jgi:aryl-alcohol dehydrogenase-like predicted oxidoreductase